MKLCLFFTYGVSLEHWKLNGSLSRELSYFEALHKKGIEVSFFTYGTQTDLEIASEYAWLKVIALYQHASKPTSKWSRLFKSVICAWTLREQFKEFDVFRSNQMLGAWVPAIAAKLFRKKFVCRVGYEWASTMEKAGKSALYVLLAKLITKSLYVSADQILVTSSRIAEEIKHEYGLEGKNIFVFPNFIDTELFKPDPTLLPEPNILFVGRLSREKNIDVLIEASALTTMPLWVVGTGPEEAKLREKAEKLKARVLFLGNKPNSEIASLLQRSSFFALLSSYEGNPKALLEAMATGISVIGSKVPGISDLLTPLNGEPCGVTTEIQAEALADKLIMLKENPTLRRKLSENAQKRVAESCSITHIVSRECKLYFQTEQMSR